MASQLLTSQSQNLSTKTISHSEITFHKCTMYRYLEVLIGRVCDHGLYIKNLQSQEHAAYVTRMNIIFSYTALSLLADHRATQKERTAHFINCYGIFFIYTDRNLYRTQDVLMPSKSSNFMCVYFCCLSH